MRARNLLLIGIGVALVADVVGYTFAQLVPCEELGCIGIALGAGAFALIVAGIGIGFLLKTPQELWVAAATGALMVGFLVAAESIRGNVPSAEDIALVGGMALFAAAIVSFLAAVVGLIRRWRSR